MYVSSEVLHQPRSTESRRWKERKDEKITRRNKINIKRDEKEKLTDMDFHGDHEKGYT